MAQKRGLGARSVPNRKTGAPKIDMAQSEKNAGKRRWSRNRCTECGRSPEPSRNSTTAVFRMCSECLILKKVTVIELWRIIAQDHNIGSKVLRISLIRPDQTTDSESVVRQPSEIS